MLRQALYHWAIAMAHRNPLNAFPSITFQNLFLWFVCCGALGLKLSYWVYMNYKGLLYWRLSFTVSEGRGEACMHDICSPGARLTQKWVLGTKKHSSASHGLKSAGTHLPVYIISLNLGKNVQWRCHCSLLQGWEWQATLDVSEGWSEMLCSGARYGEVRMAVVSPQWWGGQMWLLAEPAIWQVSQGSHAFRVGLSVLKVWLWHLWGWTIGHITSHLRIGARYVRWGQLVLAGLASSLLERTRLIEEV